MGSFTVEEANNLAIQIMLVRFRPGLSQEERTVDATLGADSVRRASSRVRSLCWSWRFS